MSFCQLLYLARYMPYKNRQDSVIAIANESTVLLVLAVLLAYTDDKMDAEVGNNVGFVLIGIISSNVAANSLIFIQGTVKDLHTFVKQLYQKLKSCLLIWEVKA